MKYPNELGKFGEKISIEYLRNNGYKILARNFRMGRYGEIDIIAKESKKRKDASADF